MGVGEIILIIVCVLIVGGVIAMGVYNKVKGKRGCGCGCDCCPHAKQCGGHNGDKEYNGGNTEEIDSNNGNKAE